MKLDLITFGHTTTDVFLKVSDAVVKCDVNHQNCQLCFDYAEKIPVDSFNREIGGNAPNTGIGASRLGLNVSIVSSIGNDSNGEFVLNKLKNEGIKFLENITKDSFGTDYSTIINFKGERTILAFHEKRSYIFPSNLTPAKWGYLSSMGEDFLEFNNKFLSWAKENGVKIAFNPGMYELKAGIGQIKNVLENANLIIVNKEEAESLLFRGSIKVEENIKELLIELRKLGSKAVIITNGREGAYSYNNKEFLYMKTFPGNRIEMTGAGDSFSSGVLSALISGNNIGESLRWGAANSSSVIQKIGAIEGLLPKEQMKKTLQNNKSIVPVVI